MKRVNVIRLGIATLAVLGGTIAGCVELNRKEKMTTFSGTSKTGRTIPGNQGQTMPKEHEFPSK